VSAGLTAPAGAQRRPVTSPGLGASAVITATSTESPAPASPAPAVGLRVMRFVDPSRMIKPERGRPEPRTLLTYVRYPAVGAAGQTDVLNATPTISAGPYPLVVFGHGFAVTPQLYATLLRSWARAGYVVAAPVFPLGNADAPGGPDEADVINEPADMSFVISRLLSLNGPSAGDFAGMVDPTRIAVAGHSDGGEAALAAAYSCRLRDPRVSAAVILSGAEISGIGGYCFPKGSPSLLAAQGTADRSNEPRFTNAYFALAQRPKFLLRLLGAGHRGPYTAQQPQLAIVERVTVAFLDRYLKQQTGALQRMISLGSISLRSALRADP
jgi:dienelactone hydrolase